MSCEHLNFSAQVDVNRLTKTEGGPVTNYACEIHVSCGDCGQPFRFFCPDIGMLVDRPAISPDGTELRVYVEPSDGSLVRAVLPGFSISAADPLRPGRN